MIEIIKEAKTSLTNQIKEMITSAQPVHISPLDACTCTGNCPGIC